DAVSACASSVRRAPPPRSSPLSLHDALPISQAVGQHAQHMRCAAQRVAVLQTVQRCGRRVDGQVFTQPGGHLELPGVRLGGEQADRKSTRLNSSHVKISYAVFCLKKKTTHDA